MAKHRKHQPSSSQRVIGQISYHDGRNHRVVPIHNKRELMQQFALLDAQPWIGRYRYEQLR